MTLIDGLLLAAILSVAVLRLLPERGGRRWRLIWTAVVAAAAVLQVAVEGFTWQFVPAYVLILAGFWPRWRGGAAGIWIGRLALVALIGMGLGPWVLLPVPKIPQPDGRYSVGTVVYRWTDPTRPEAATTDPADRRGVIVQAWYPTARDHAKGRGQTAVPYMDGLGRLPPTVNFLPAFIFKRFGAIDTHAQPAAPLAAGSGPWPVVIFSPGYGAPRSAYTALLTRLASRGFVVLALDHPYEAAVTELENGKVVGPIERFIANDPDRTGYMSLQLAVRTADVRYVLDKLAEPGALKFPLAGQLDASRVAVVGHSFGGATAAAALDVDPRVAVAVNIDGTPYGDLPNHKLKGPFLLLQSDYDESHHSQAFLNGNHQLLVGATSGVRYEIKRANHYSFTDLPLFFSPPGRWLLARVMGGERGPEETQRAAVDIVTAFIDGPLGRPPTDVTAAAARYRDIPGGPVKP